MASLLLNAPETAVAAATADVDDLAHVVSRRAESRGEATFLRDARSQHRTSFVELADAVARWEGWLSATGVRRGESVALCVGDPLEFSRVYVAVIAAGRWAAPIDPAAPAAVVGSLLDRLRPTLVITDRPELADQSGGSLGSIPWFTTAGSPVATHLPVAAHYRGLEVDDGGGTGGVLLFSSGSTGIPKLIQLHEHQLLAGARAVATGHCLDESDIGFSPLPLSHINAEVVGVLATLWAGSSLVLDRRFHRTDFWALMDRHAVTWINAVPAMLSHLSNLVVGESVPDRIRFVRSASAPLPVATLRRFEAATGVPVVETYGMTEAAGQIAANPLRGPRKPGSVGLPVGFELRIVADSIVGRPQLCDRHVPGHVEIRGRSVELHCDSRPAVHPSGRDGSDTWFRTGDLGYVDDDGYLFLVGRRDDVINRGGEKVYPREIEEVLCADPQVADAVVIGCEHDALGEVPVAYVSIHGVADHSELSTALTIGDLARACLIDALPPGKRPVALHVLGRLPTTANGKVARRRVADGDVIATLAVP